MAYSRLLLLLLLIGVTVTHLPQVHARPADFWCNKDARQSLMATFENKDNCQDVLPSPVAVPCVRLSLLQWENKTIQEKQAEVLENFQVFQDGVQHLKNQTSLECGASLEIFEHNILQYVKIVGRAYRQHDGSMPPQAPTQTCGEKKKLSDVWKTYSQLIIGKLEYLAIDTDCNQVKKRTVRQLQPKGP